MLREKTGNIRFLGAVVSVRGSADAVLADFAAAGVNDETLAADLQQEGTVAFAKFWSELLLRIASKRDLP